MSAFSKLPLSFAVLVSLAGIACAANKIALSCTGTIASKETAFEQAPISPVSLLVDLDLGTVTGSLGTFTILKVSETSIAFRGAESSGVRRIVGGVDRVSGSAGLTAWLDDTHILYNYQLNWRRANPLF